MRSWKRRSDLKGHINLPRVIEADILARWWWGTDGGGRGAAHGQAGSVAGVADGCLASSAAGAAPDGPASSGIYGETDGPTVSGGGVVKKLLPQLGKHQTALLEVAGHDHIHDHDHVVHEAYH
ncbi:UNVERIFIED_CONTAM: hypothetical protein Slati_1443900 [Sesamum latifolium]|uniref:Uncharacterized protein n=1 Tax=Sesamum latifolium TaxID=2727402 RepID=A0AAW2X9L5_9LAMI